MSCITTSHAFAKELLSKPDSFITAMIEGREYIIEDYRRKATHSNVDDNMMYYVINLRDGGQGNIKR